jgi:DNA-binding transcriptional LysR family regulator
MSRIQLNELAAFAAVARHRSFTKGAAQVGVALPTMSQTIRSLEDRLGVRLFNRTTRSVALTEAGERLLTDVQVVLDGVDHALDRVNSFRDKPAGTLRLAVTRPFATTLLAPLIQPFLAEYPSISLDISVDDIQRDIVRGRFDAGITTGHRIERDMTVFRISDELKMLAVAAPSYLARHGRPLSPEDLHSHDCINYRLPWSGTIFPWALSKGGESIEVSTQGPLIVNDPDLLLSAILDGVGIGYATMPMVAPYISDGRLAPVLEDWTHTQPGVYLYYPSRRQMPMPLQVFMRFVDEARKGRR